MSKFPTGGHLSSWAGRTALDSQSMNITERSGRDLGVPRFDGQG